LPDGTIVEFPDGASSGFISTILKRNSVEGKPLYRSIGGVQQRQQEIRAVDSNKPSMDSFLNFMSGGFKPDIQGGDRLSNIGQYAAEDLSQLAEFGLGGVANFANNANQNQDNSVMDTVLAGAELIPSGALAGQTARLAGKGASRLFSEALDQSLRSPMTNQAGVLGSPTPNIPGRGLTPFSDNEELMQLSKKYGEASGIPQTPLRNYQAIDEGRAGRIAAAYENMKHDPLNPEVNKAYTALAEETKAQYKSLIDAGYKPRFHKPGVDPYLSSPYEAVIDVNENKSLSIYPTREGFGTDDAFDVTGNPLLEDSGFKIDGEPALINDLFRFVHDVFGHSKAGVGFRAAGEENAFQSHAGMFSPLARKALATETRGQNSWLNYGPYGGKNRTAKIGDTVFGDQKTGLLPDWAVNEGLTTSARPTQFDGAIDENGMLEMSHYSHKKLDSIDPKFTGQGLSRNVRSEANRRGDENYVNRSSYGILAKENPYKRENGLGGVENKVTIDPSRLYDAKLDPEGLWKEGKGDVTLSERKVKDAGYSGYFVDHSRLGKVAQVFETLPVKK
jgi:hypothetical protein